MAGALPKTTEPLSTCADLNPFGVKLWVNCASIPLTAAAARSISAAPAADAARRAMTAKRYFKGLLVRSDPLAFNRDDRRVDNKRPVVFAPVEREEEEAVLFRVEI